MHGTAEHGLEHERTAARDRRHLHEEVHLPVAGGARLHGERPEIGCEDAVRAAQRRGHQVHREPRMATERGHTGAVERAHRDERAGGRPAAVGVYDRRGAVQVVRLARGEHAQRSLMLITDPVASPAARLAETG